ncbi:phosphoenolpyruvate carboxykinase (GTP) [Kutzneria sp. CA-103260]|uniref:phosphoenolpyruvate carboxykinase (GTP) n=1 Tax=Kutzneria sp. CA-103260 TaxID=2802641 RepID=UPI001BAD68A7|nr:phosphoenolpyruvate carboxykinase (GTP) [Kutzneria sp. CA-103260]QUQ64241.1 phosphoenolpyruvate carboxykinase [Kutzneria sp. CA-103260]
MTITDPGLGRAPTTHGRLLAWVREVAELTTPEQVVWCDGSDQEWDQLTGQLVEAGTLVPLTAKSNSFRAVSDPADAARAADRTFVCSRDPADAGPTNNWMDPVDMKIILTEQFRGAMRGRTMYVIPFCLGPLGGDNPKLGVEITDSAYAVVSMRLLTRMGTAALDAFIDDSGAERDFVRCLHSVGAPLAPGQPDVPWPCDNTKYISHFPEERMIWSYGSGYGGNALLGKECHALRIASVLARDEGWLAEHMLVLKLTTAQDKVYYVAAAFPAGCGTTTLAMLEPTIPGWKVEILGDDIAWLWFGADGRLYAVNPGCGFFDVAPGTNHTTKPNAVRTIDQGNTVFTHVDSRYCTPMRQCPVLAPEWDDPEGVPISAILFGGRRATTVPLVTESRDWQHGVFLGATLSSETSSGGAGDPGVVRRNPMAMLPFLGYHVGDYLRHWIDMGTRSDALPTIFLVNWFRRGEDGRLLWPGFGENSRVLRWVVERIEGTASAVVTPIGYVPTAAALELSGLDAPVEDVRAAIAADRTQWWAELPHIRDWFDTIGDKLPTELVDELNALTHRLVETP